MAVNVKALSEDVILEMAMKEAKRIGFELISMRRLKHEADYYLRYVICYSANREEYCTWLYNVECGGLHLGHYFQHWNISKDEAYQLAMDDFNQR